MMLQIRNCENAIVKMKFYCSKLCNCEKFFDKKSKEESYEEFCAVDALGAEQKPTKRQFKVRITQKRTIRAQCSVSFLPSSESKDFKLLVLNLAEFRTRSNYMIVKFLESAQDPRLRRNWRLELKQ